MRNSFLLFCFILFCNFIYGQTRTQEFYFKKSKNQKKIAWILLGTGAAAIVTGSIIDSNKERGDQSISTASPIGLICALGSIPFFSSSSKNKKRARALSISNQRVLQLNDNIVAWKALPTVSLKISLNR